MIDTTILQLKEAADRLGSTVFFVRTLIWREELPYIKIGKRFCVVKHDLDRWIEQNRVRVGDEESGQVRGNRRLRS